MTPYLQKAALFPPQIELPPAKDLQLVVVIPAYREPHLLASLESLKAATLPPVGVEVLVVLNDGEKDGEEVRAFHQQSFRELRAWAAEQGSEQRQFHLLYQSQLPAKHAGVGLARKIGMDEAVYRLEQCGHSKGIIACFDADSRCAPNYLQALYDFFQQQPSAPACSIYFEHPLEGLEFAPEVYAAIAEYELHLRYYLQAQRWAGFPLAYHTVGSSMAVRADAYQQQGGMNRRKAGEDFYFLHKFIALDHFGELMETTVFPSPRISERVPFGTGKAVGSILQTAEAYPTYAWDIFVDLQCFLQGVDALWDLKALDVFLEGLPPVVKDFLRTQSFTQKIQEIRGNTANRYQFRKRFFRWFNAFQLMKYVHFARDHYYPSVPVLEAANRLLAQEGMVTEQTQRSTKACLAVYRQWQGQAWQPPS